MRILVSFLSALALLTTQSIYVEAQSAEAMNATANPNANATKAPSEVPVEETIGKDHCTDQVEVARTCYDWSGPAFIEIKVTNCNPYGKDWIAIYDDDVDYSEVGYDKGYDYWGTSYDWTFLCGSRECDHPTTFNYLYFHDWWDNEHLVDGHYKIYLFRDNGFRVDAESESFRIKNKYHYCGSHPTHHPTPHPTPSHPTPHPVHPTSHPAPSHKPVHPTHHPVHPTRHPVHPTPHPVHPSHHPTPHPTPSNKPVHPTRSPTAKPAPTLFPTSTPTDFCEQDIDGKFTLWSNGRKRKCKWAGQKINKIDKRCNQRTTTDGVKVKDECPRTCKACRDE